MDYYKTFCSNLCFLRENKAVAKSELAKILNITEEQYSDIEKGKEVFPFSLEQLKAICSKYNINADKLLFSNIKNKKRTGKGKTLSPQKYENILQEINETLKFIDKNKKQFLKSKDF